MTEKIEKQIENINRSIDWVSKYKPQDFNARFLQLVEERRKLRKLLSAQRENPAIAAYGISQVGKSYLMNSMLQKDGKQFQIEADGRKYNFIEEMNPQTKNTEATGVVTRFSSFKRNPQLYSAAYPIMMRCLSVKDIIIIISEGYYNDISDYTTYSEKDITEISDRIYGKYSAYAKQEQPVLTADDVLDIRAYLAKHINNAQAFLHTTFFDRLSLVVEKIPVIDLPDVLAPLWHGSTYQVKIFTKLLDTLQKLRFAEYVYLPAQALLHNGMNENTIMSVQCLNELFLSTPKYFTNVYLRNGDTFTEISQVPKSEICGICAEVIVKIDKEYLEYTDSYCLDGISDPQVLSQLTKGEVTMDILRDNDLLDFPGARTRKKEQLATLAEDAILVNVLLRGKVAYLFNMYNEARQINILLYCHHNEQNEVTDIPVLLKNWITTYVGDTLAKRARIMQLTGGISPLFYIATKFNIDMQLESADIANSDNALNGRWQQRFEKVLYHQCFNADGCLDSEDEKIFLNWDAEGKPFSNSFLLRDYKYSGPLYSKLYEHEKDPQQQSVMTIDADYYARMRNTFVNSPCVRKFFTMPELAWDVAASVDNDGSLYILEQLSKIAKRMDATREEQFSDILSSCSRKLTSIMKDYYVTTDINKILEQNIGKCMAIYRELDFTCNSDNYYFGHLQQALQTSESETYQVIHDVIQGPQLNVKVNESKDFEIIRNSCKKRGFDLDAAKSREEKLEMIKKTYFLGSIDDVVDYLKRKNIDIDQLLSQTTNRKLNSYIISDAVFDSWADSIKSVDFITKFADEKDFDSLTMGNLTENLISTANAVKLRDKMADTIAEYVNVVNVHSANETLLADLLASKINNFILDFGYSYLTEKEIEGAKKICDDMGLPAFNYINREQEPATIESLTAIFDTMMTSPMSLLPSFEDNYNRWVEYMIISFVAHLNVPEDFNFEANEQLEGILKSVKSDS